jgi:transposase
LSAGETFCYLQNVSTTPPPFPPSPSCEAELIEQLKNQLGQTRDRLQLAELKIQLLEERLRLVRIAKYGASSEKLSDAQLELLELEPGVSNVEVQAESQREPLETNSRRKRKHPGRQQLPADLPRVERVVACTAEQCVCEGCGQQKALIGYEESEHLDVQPAQYFVVVSKREKRACRKCEEQGVVTAPLPPRIIEKGLVSDRIVIDTIVNKYCGHLPLYRQSLMLEQDLGVELSRATLDGWVMRVGELLQPITSAMKRELLSGSYIQADETPVPVQMHDNRGKNHEAYLWQYGRPGGSVVFDFRMGRGREGPKQFLGQFEGILQTDGYRGYDKVGGPKLLHACCWSHSRRYFHKAVQLHPTDVASIGILKLIGDLFTIDAEAREQTMDLAARHALRQERARPLLGKIEEQIKAAKSTALPGSALAKGCRYTLKLWPKLTRFLDYPELELSNNLAENSMRPVAIGRKNWVHVGSAQAGPKIAAILSVVESCRRLKVHVRDYLAAVLPGLAETSIQRVAELTPSAWTAQNR